MRKISFILMLPLFSDLIFCSQRSDLPKICVKEISLLIKHLSKDDDKDLTHLKKMLSIKKNQIDKYNTMISTDYAEGVSISNDILSDEAFLSSMVIEDIDLQNLRNLSNAILRDKKIDPVLYFKQHGWINGTKFFVKNFCIPKSFESWGLAAIGVIATYSALSSYLRPSGIRTIRIPEMPVIEIKDLREDSLSVSKALMLFLGTASAAIAAITKKNWVNYFKDNEQNRNNLIARIENIIHQNNNISLQFQMNGLNGLYGLYGLYDEISNIKKIQSELVDLFKNLEANFIAKLTGICENFIDEIKDLEARIGFKLTEIEDSLTAQIRISGADQAAKLIDVRDNIINEIKDFKTNIAVELADVKVNIAAEITNLGINQTANLATACNNISSEIKNLEVNTATRLTAIENDFKVEIKEKTSQVLDKISDEFDQLNSSVDRVQLSQEEYNQNIQLIAQTIDIIKNQIVTLDERSLHNIDDDNKIKSSLNKLHQSLQSFALLQEQNNQDNQTNFATLRQDMLSMQQNKTVRSPEFNYGGLRTLAVKALSIVPSLLDDSGVVYRSRNL